MLRGTYAARLVVAAPATTSDEKVGATDDLIVSRTDRTPCAIISPGGFLGTDKKLVAVPMGNLQFSMNHTLLAGADKETLEDQPFFTYAK